MEQLISAKLDEIEEKELAGSIPDDHKKDLGPLDQVFRKILMQTDWTK